MSDSQTAEGITVFRGARKQPRVSIRKNGSIVFMPGAEQAFKFGSKITHVQLAFDHGTSRVLLIVCKESDEAAFQTTMADGYYVIYCRKFLKKFNVEHSSSSRYRLVRETEYPGMSGKEVYWFSPLEPLEGYSGEEN